MTTTNLSNLIITRILRDQHVTLTQLEHRATERGVLLSDLYQALDKVHRDKRVKRNVKGGEIVYEVAKAKPTAVSHTQWVTANYPPMTADNDGSGIDADFSYLFLTPDEMKEYKATAKGLPAYMINKYARKQNPT